MKKIYLDYSASTPLDREVLKEMHPFLREKFGNPSSLHSFGQEAVSAIDNAREAASKSLGTNFNEIIFTSSATESNNLAIRGVVKKFKSENPERAPHIITTAIEHEAVINTCKDLERDGVEVTYLPVDTNGLVKLDKLENSLKENTILVSIIYVNNVVGSIQPISEIAKIIQSYRRLLMANHRKLLNDADFATENRFPLLHTDAVQAFQYLNCDVQNLDLDLMSLSSHKIYGPKGVGLLCVRKLPTTNYSIQPILTGGSQEFDLRASTPNVPAIVGFGKAVEITDKNRAGEYKKIKELKQYLWRELKKIAPEIQANPPSSPADEKNFLPHILNISFPKCSSQDILIKLDQVGIAVSAGAACASRSSKPSYVLKAIGIPDNQALRSIRFSLGKQTTKKELQDAVKRIRNIF